MDISQANWSTTDADNDEAAPDGAPEGMAPGGVNNVLRAHQGAIKRWYEQTVPVTTAGTASAYTVAYSVTPTALADGQSHTVTFHAANAAAATLDINGLGAKPIHYFSAGAWRVVPAGLWAAERCLRVAYNTTAATYRIIDLDDRTGVVEAFAGATAPAGSLLCYGQAISRTDYAGLFAALSTTHGVGDGSATFNLPDLRGRVTAGKGDMGGSESGRLNTVIPSILGSAAGVQTYTLTVGDMPAHAHTGVDHFHTGEGGGQSFAYANYGAAWGNISVGAGNAVGAASLTGPADRSLDTGSAGSGGAHNNTQPTIVLNYIIRI